MRTFSFIVNPFAGARRVSPEEHPLVAEIRGHCPAAEVLVCDKPGQARQWARERSMRADHVVVAVGGDGTVHEVGGGLIGGRASMGVIPTGSGNDFAKMLTSPRDPAAAVAFLAQAPARRCDAGEVYIEHADGRAGTHYFLNGLGIGFDAAVAEAVNRARFLKGFPAYLAAAVRQLFRYRPPVMSVAFNEVSMTARQFLVALGNGRWAGGRFKLTPEARIDDGWLDLCRADAMKLRRVLRILPAVFAGRHGRFGEVSMARTRRLVVDCKEGCMVHADGEVLARRAVKIRARVLPGALEVIG